MLTALWIVFVVVAGLDLWAKAAPHPRLERVVKPGAMLVLLLIATLSPAGGSGLRWLLLAALVASLAGDVFLLSDAPNAFVAGLGSFLVSHLLYAVLFLALGLAAPLWAGLAALVLVGVLVATRPIVRGARSAGGGVLGGAVTAYMLVIAAMAVLGWGTGAVLVGLGASAFVVSDTILGWDRFVAAKRWGGVAVMATYLGAQALLVLGVLGRLTS